MTRQMCASKVMTIVQSIFTANMNLREAELMAIACLLNSIEPTKEIRDHDRIQSCTTAPCCKRLQTSTADTRRHMCSNKSHCLRNFGLAGVTYMPLHCVRRSPFHKTCLFTLSSKIKKKRMQACHAARANLF